MLHVKTPAFLALCGYTIIVANPLPEVKKVIKSPLRIMVENSPNELSACELVGLSIESKKLGETMKQELKKTIQQVWPSLYFTISSYKFQQYCKKRFQKFQSQFHRAVYSEDEIKVLSGPFTGMKYYDRIVWGAITPKWVGSYEQQLHTIINKIIGIQYDKVIDIGAAEGYYAVGLALRSPQSQVICYDIDPIARRRQFQLSTLNVVKNMKICRYCTHQNLAADIQDESVVICDIEGYEVVLLDPAKCPELIRADILVEIYNFEDKGVEDVRSLLESRFSETHTIKSFDIADYNLGSLKNISPLAKLPDSILLEAVNEHRSYSQCWLWMEAEQGAAVKALPHLAEL